MSLVLSQMIFDINWAIFRIKVTFRGHITLTLMSLEKVLWVECACPKKFLSLMVQKAWPRITCDTNGAIFRIKVTVKVIYLKIISKCIIG